MILFNMRRLFVHILGCLLLLSNSTMAFSKTPVAILYDPIFLTHDTGSGHPERPERLFDVIDTLQYNPDVKYDLIWPKLRKASNKEIGLVHTQDYINTVEKEIKAITNSPSFLSTGDTVISKNSLEVVQTSVGGGLVGIDTIMSGKAKSAFSFNRPPGHHATYDKGMGFCIYNHIAIAARYLQEQYNVKKILIIDFDVHHGNGTQDIFYNDNSVYYFSVHQHPFYPGSGRPNETGNGVGKGFTMNVDLAKGSGNEQFIASFNDKLIPEMDNFKPEFILISAGFDAYEHDLLGQLKYTGEGYREVAKIINNTAKKHHSKGIMYMLEGGYVPENIEDASINIIKELVNYQ